MHLTLEIIPKLGIYLLFHDVKGHTSFDRMDEETVRQREKSIFSYALIPSWVFPRSLDFILFFVFVFVFGFFFLIRVLPFYCSFVSFISTTIIAMSVSPN